MNKNPTTALTKGWQKLRRFTLHLSQAGYTEHFEIISIHTKVLSLNIDILYQISRLPHSFHNDE